MPGLYLACTQAVANTPVAAAIYASDAFTAWGQSDETRAEIFDDIENCSGDAPPNHAVALIGYGKDEASGKE
jgi:hypothetical protein